MYLKTAIVLACFGTSYMLLVFVAKSVWQGLPLVTLLGLSVAGIGFNIAHDGGHRAYAKASWANKLAAMTMDLIGVSSYVWFWKHAVIHHRYVNVTGYDTDCDIGILGRLSPHSKRLPFHRWQHFYFWPLYGVTAAKMQFVDDFKRIIRGRIGGHGIPRPTGWDLVIFITGKMVFLGWAFLVPLLFHPLGVVLFYYGVGVLMLGKSGIGKSEIALDLVMRGHRLVADDIVNLTRRAGDVYGHGNDLIQHHMEIRGLGILNIKDLFGVAAVRDRKKIELIIEFVEWTNSAEYDRLGLDEKLMPLVGVEAPLSVVPVRPGRNMTTIVEVAARNHLLKLRGHHSAQEFAEKVTQAISGSRGGAPHNSSSVARRHHDEEEVE